MPPLVEVPQRPHDDRVDKATIASTVLSGVLKRRVYKNLTQDVVKKVMAVVDVDALVEIAEELERERFDQNMKTYVEKQAALRKIYAQFAPTPFSFNFHVEMSGWLLDDGTVLRGHRHKSWFSVGEGGRYIFRIMSLTIDLEIEFKVRQRLSTDGVIVTDEPECYIALGDLTTETFVPWLKAVVVECDLDLRVLDWFEGDAWYKYIRNGDPLLAPKSKSAKVAPAAADAPNEGDDAPPPLLPASPHWISTEPPMI